jgi:uroporphyrinogen-III decarboxylase
MTEKQWSTLVDVIKGKELKPLPVGFIIDSPWLPNWYGIKVLDYFTSDDLWFKANLHAITTFPEVIFLPGFWSEYGMCSEPSAFGATCSLPLNEFPHARKNIHSIADISRLSPPNPATDGLAPFILNRLVLNAGRIEESGHRIYFPVSRGPLNIASFLMGVQEFLMAMITHPEDIHRLLDIITGYLVSWHDLQREAIPTIDGILVLDDIIGFIGEEEFRAFGLPYLKRLYDRDLTIKFLHNDADCRSSVKYLPEIGVNLFNMGFDTSLSDLKDQTGHKVAMLGNIPPRDVLASGTRGDIETNVKEMLEGLENRRGVIASCGGGMPPGVSTENIRCFLKMVQKHS